MSEVVWSKGAGDDLKKLDRVVAKRVMQAVVRYAESGHGDVKRLQGVEREWRLRVGDWRVRFTLGTGGEIVVLHVL